jgi:MFS family permease
MTNGQCAMPGHDHGCIRKRVSWSAIITGALVGLGLSFLLNLFSVAIGLSLMTTSKEGLITLAIGGFIGLIIGTIVSTFISGFTAGYLGRAYCDRNIGVIYGFTTWCLALLITIMFAANISRYVASYSDFISNPTVVVVTEKNVTMKETMTPTPNVMTVETQKATNTFGMTSLLIFVLFFIGAISSCFGGYYGMSCCRED